MHLWTHVCTGPDQGAAGVYHGQQIKLRILRVLARVRSAQSEAGLISQRLHVDRGWRRKSSGALPVRASPAPIPHLDRPRVSCSPENTQKQRPQGTRVVYPRVLVPDFDRVGNAFRYSFFGSLCPDSKQFRVRGILYPPTRQAIHVVRPRGRELCFNVWPSACPVENRALRL